MLQLLISNVYEFIGVFLKNIKTVVLCLHKPSSTDQNTFINVCDVILTNVEKPYYNCELIVMGGFNINFLTNNEYVTN